MIRPQGSNPEQSEQVCGTHAPFKLDKTLNFDWDYKHLSQDNINICHRITVWPHSKWSFLPLISKCYSHNLLNHPVRLIGKLSQIYTSHIMYLSWCILWGHVFYNFSLKNVKFQFFKPKWVYIIENNHFDKISLEIAESVYELWCKNPPNHLY